MVANKSFQSPPSLQSPSGRAQLTSQDKLGRLSVIITCCNQGSLIVPMLSALLRDLAPDDEVIISDDGSTDGSAQLIRQSFGSDGRVRVLESVASHSVSQTRNRGIALATGDWVSFLDGDDEYCAGRRQHLSEGVSAFPNAQFLFTDYTHWQPQNKQLPEFRALQARNIHSQLMTIAGGDQTSWNSVDANELTLLLLEHGCVVHLCCYALKRSWIESRALRFDPRLMVAEDTDFTFRALQGANVAFLPVTTARYRINDAGLSARHDTAARTARLMQRMSNLQLPITAPNRRGESAAWQQVGYAEVQLAYQYRLDGHYRSALRYALRSFVTTPSRCALTEIAKSIWSAAFSRAPQAKQSAASLPVESAPVPGSVENVDQSQSESPARRKHRLTA